MKRLCGILGISSLLTIFWFCVGYVSSLLFHFSINVALIFATLAFIFSFVTFSIFTSIDPTEKYR